MERKKIYVRNSKYINWCLIYIAQPNVTCVYYIIHGYICMTVYYINVFALNRAPSPTSIPVYCKNAYVRRYTFIHAGSLIINNYWGMRRRQFGPWTIVTIYLQTSVCGHKRHFNEIMTPAILANRFGAWTLENHMVR